MSKRFTAVVSREQSWHVARCLELGVVSQGKTIEEAQAKLPELIDHLATGEELVITRNRQPIARLLALKQANADRQKS